MWEQTGDTRWERADGHATLWCRATADGRWAVTLDRLEQAPEGPGYRRETVDGEAEALALAAEWREAEAPPGPDDDATDDTDTD